MRLKVFIILFLISFGCVFAQSYKHFSIENGLPSNLVYKVIQDKEGFIWIATDKGVSKFDGKSFRTFTTLDGLPTNDIWNINLTNDNRIWFFSHSDKQGYIRNDTVFAFPNETGMVLYPVSYAVNPTENKLNFRTIKGDTYNLENEQWKMLKDEKKPLYVFHKHVKSISINKSVLSFTGKDGKLISREDGLPASFSFVQGQINDSLVVMYSGSTLYFINLNRQKIYRLKRPDLFSHEKITRVFATERDIQISGNGYWGQLSPDYRIKNLQHFPGIDNIISVFRDKKKNYWINTFNSGTYFVNHLALQSHYALKGKILLDIKKSGKNIFANVRNEGIYKYDSIRQDFILFYPDKSYIFDFLIKSSGDYIIGSLFNLYIREKGKNQRHKEQVKKIEEIDGIIYFMTSGGLGIYTPGMQKFEASVPLNNIKVLTGYKGYLIAGTKVGLYELYPDLSLASYRKLPGFDKPVLSVKKAGENLLIGTDGSGLYVYDGKGNFQQVKDTDGMIVNGMEISGDRLILATQKGLLFYRLEDGQPPVFQKTLRKVDGLMSDQVNHVIVLGDRIFAGSYNGVAVLPLYQAEKFPMQDIYFESITYNGQPPGTDRKIRYAGDSNLRARFGVIDYSGQEHHKYYYRLLPLQKHWTEIPSGIINFGNLSPAVYQLQVKAVNPYRQYMIKDVSFQIMPLWWQTRWGRLLFILTGVALVALFFYGLKQRELKKQQRKLITQKEMAEHELHALRSQMNPHFVFNSLNAIQSYINDENYEQSEDFLVKFARLIRMIFDFSSKKSIPLEEEINLLRSYLDLEKMRFGDDFNYCIHIDEKLDIRHTEIPTMLLQPIVENAVNHGIFHKEGKGTICLAFKKTDDKTFEVKVSDDGVGIKKSQEINRNSLKKHRSKSTEILMDRIKLLNLSGHWKIFYKLMDLTGKGISKYNTVVKLKITKL